MLVKTKVGLQRLVKEIQGLPLAVDLETTSDDVHEAEVVGVALATKDGEWYVPVQTLTENGWAATRFHGWWPEPLGELLKRAPYLIFHNAPFDIGVLRRYRLHPAQPAWAEEGFKPVIIDTMGLAHLFNEALPLSLKRLAYIILDRRPEDYQIEHFRDIEQAAAYAAADARNTYDLAVWFWDALDGQDLLDFYKRFVQPLPLIVEEMEAVGYWLDMERIEQDRAYLREHAEHLRQRLTALGPGLENPNSPQQLAGALKALGMRWRKGWYTKNGAPSTKADVIEEAAKVYTEGALGEFLSLLLEYRKTTKMLGFIESGKSGLLKLRRGRQIFPSWNPYGTTTWRWSCSNPNLQQMPRPVTIGDYEVNPRRWFVAPPGWLMVVADLEQAELRVLAGLSGDRVMAEAYEKGTDIHALTASLVYGVPIDQVTKEQRYVGKTVNFASVYGAGPGRIASLTGLSIKEAKAVIEGRAKAYPQAAWWERNSLREVAMYGIVWTYYGQPRRPVYAQANRYYMLSEDEAEPGEERAWVAALETELRKDPHYRMNLEQLRDRVKRDSSFLRELMARGQRQGRNAVIQGTVAGHINRALIEITQVRRRLHLACCIVGQVHDEVHLIAPERKAKEVARMLEDVLHGDINGVELTAEARTGRSWAEAK